MTAMRRLLSFLLATLVAPIALQCAAQTNGCPSGAGNGPVLALPAAPNSSQTIVAVIGVYAMDVGADEHGISVSTKGNSIAITMTGINLAGFDPPMGCGPVSIGSLAAGTYTVNLFAVDTGSSHPAPVLEATATLTVAPGQDPATVPTLSAAALAALALLLSLAGLFTFRRGTVLQIAASHRPFPFRSIEAQRSRRGRSGRRKHMGKRK